MPPTKGEAMQRRHEPPLLFLWHPGTRDIFSGYGLAIAPLHLIGLMMVDHPRTVDPVWSKNCHALLRPHLGTSTPSSEGQKPDGISPLLRVHGRPNEQYIFHRRRNRQPLRDNQHAWTCCRGDERGKMSWHGFLIVGDQHAPVVCCQGQHLRIAQTRKAGSRCGLEIQGGRTADDRMQNDLVQIRVSLKA